MSGGGDDMPHEEHEEHANHESWVIPYADLLTLLMAMFIALFAISSVNPDKAKKVSAGFADNMKSPLSGLFTGSKNNSVTEGKNPGGTANGTGGTTGPDRHTVGAKLIQEIAEERAKISAAKAMEHQSLTGVRDKITAAAKKVGLAGKITFDLKDNGLVIRLVTDNVLFASGDDALQSNGQEVLKLVADILASVPDNPLRIEGHTDSVPIHNARFKSNWGLSTARAESVLLFLNETGGIKLDRMRLAGWADTHPFQDNGTTEGRAANRRVEIIIESKVIDELLNSNHLNDATTPKPAPAQPAVDIRHPITR